MRSSILSGAAALLAAAQLVSAQTFTSCNPTTNSSCAPDVALGKTITVDFTKGSSSYFTEAQGTSLTYDSTNGASFIMSQEGQAPTITSNFYIFFGKVTVVTQAAPGTGVVSSFVMESDDLDEIDWEWLGGTTTSVESNYFGKGNTSTYDRALYHPVTTPQTEFHTYTIDWSKEQIVWSIDGTEVRTLAYASAVDGKNFPQTPMVIKIGNWDGGASTENAGTIEWAGGSTDWTQAPFTMFVKSVTIEDSQTGATSYKYGDESGSYDSIVVSDGSSSASVSGAAASATASASASASSSSSASASASFTASATLSAASRVAAASSAASASGSSSSGSSITADQSNSSSGSSSSGSTTTSSSSSSSSTADTTNSNGASSRYGTIDVAVLVLGLTLGYFFM